MASSDALCCLIADHTDVSQLSVSILAREMYALVYVKVYHRAVTICLFLQPFPLS